MLNKQPDYTNRITRGDWVVRPVALSVARSLVEEYHYAKSGSNTGTYVHGLFRKGEDLVDTNCLGVAWWIPPTKTSAIATFPEGEWGQVLSLTRLVVVPGVPKNAASFLLAKSIRLINKERWRCLVTYADEWQGHTGSIYRATNWEYMGLTKPSTVFVKDGKMMGRKRGGRTMTKQQMIDEGFVVIGSHAKHKFRLVFK